MTQLRDDGPFEFPAERLAGGRGQRRRALLATLSVVAVVGGAIGLARLTGDSAAPAAASHRPALAAASGSAALASGAPPISTTRSSVPRVEELLDIPDRPLAG